ncbi:MAG: hypothetical protein AB1797_05925 [bacterium]
MRKCLAITVVVWFSLVGPAAANKAPRGAFDFSGLGVRAAGMGQAYVALANDASGAYYNPAGLTQLVSHQISFMHTDLFSLDLISEEFLSIATNSTVKGASAFSRASIDSKHRSWEELEYLLSYAKTVNPSLSMGVNAKYLQEDSDFDIEGGKARGYGADIGLIYKPIDSISVGVIIRDIISRLKWDTEREEHLPWQVDLGLAWNSAYLTLGTQVSGEQDSLLKKAAMGGEYRLKAGKEIELSFRTGGSSVLEKKRQILLSFGTGVNYKSWQLDYSFQYNEGLPDTHRVSALIRFE